MSNSSHAGSGREATCALTAFDLPALHLLREAADAAREVGRDVWQFAVEIDQLRALGLKNTDLRRLLCLGYLEHAWENLSADANQRVFQPLHCLALPDRSCFVLTDCGRKMASSRMDANGIVGNGQHANNPRKEPSLCLDVPRWDSAYHRLWWRDCLVKEFRVPATNQEIVLMALEEDGWPTRIDDPLPRKAHVDPKSRLHDTIKALNGHQVRRILRFRGDGQGFGIRWLYTKEGSRETP